MRPKFGIAPGDVIFTVGSCFAREIECVLQKAGLVVPVAEFTLPSGELPFNAPHMLNEYTAGTVFQRLGSMLGLFEYDVNAGIEEVSNGLFLDLFLHGSQAPVTLDRLRSRRWEIDQLYKESLTADVVIITLGLIEAWFDTKFNCYLNKTPSLKLIKSYPDRFQFHRFDYEDVDARMDPLIRNLHEKGVKIMLTVSPVPLEVSFMPEDIVINNGYAKSCLRVSAEKLYRRYEYVDYFPSFEIVSSLGLTHGFCEDNIHVRHEVVHRITAHMANGYLQGDIKIDLPTSESILRKMYVPAPHSGSVVISDSGCLIFTEGDRQDIQICRFDFPDVLYKRISVNVQFRILSPNEDARKFYVNGWGGHSLLEVSRSGEVKANPKFNVEYDFQASKHHQGYADLTFSYDSNHPSISVGLMKESHMVYSGSVGAGSSSLEISQLSVLAVSAKYVVPD